MSEANLSWYYVKDGTRQGPYSLEQLGTHDLKKDTLVWCKGMADWKPAGDIPAFSEILDPVPPPIPDSEKKQAPPPIPDAIEEEEIPDAIEEEHNTSTNRTSPPIEVEIPNLASPWKRLAAYIVEALIFYGAVVFLFSLTGEDMNELNEPSGMSYREEAIYSGLFAGVFGAIFYRLWGGNLGHKIFNLQVIDIETREVVYSSWRGFFRELAKGYLAYLILPLVILFFSSKKQNAYDYMLSTTVVDNS